ncbi:hypothetical protein LK08_22955 [Streptomyces sp. MUSC 125]|nr:hypothetical protein LK08_22955 [Streptomyces sp. MUSC 125]
MGRLITLLSVSSDMRPLLLGLTVGIGLAYTRARHARHASRAARVGIAEGPSPGTETALRDETQGG